MADHQLDHTFSALSDPTRRQIVELLSDGRSLRVSDIAQEFHVTRQAITRHLDILCSARTTRTEWRGRERYSMLADEAFYPIRDWLYRYDRFWNQKLEDLKRLVERKD